MAVYLVRHGLAAAGVADLDPGLAPLGHEQAKAAALRLQSVRAEHLIVSPLRRTRETADAIASVLGLAQEICDEVAEVFDPSMPAEQRQAMIGPFMAGRWSDQPTHLREWRRRVVDTVLEAGLAAAAANRDLVIVSHYIAIGVVIGEAIGDDRVVPQPMANASITTVELGHGGVTLIEAASVAHLSADLVTGVGSAMAGGGNAPRG